MLSVAQIVECKMLTVVMNNELGWIWKVAIIALI
jgi:hypothetical protein